MPRRCSHSRYGLPTLPFVARPTRGQDGRQSGREPGADRRVFTELDTETSGRALLRARGPELRPSALQRCDDDRRAAAMRRRLTVSPLRRLPRGRPAASDRAVRIRRRGSRRAREGAGCRFAGVSRIERAGGYESSFADFGEARSSGSRTSRTRSTSRCASPPASPAAAEALDEGQELASVHAGIGRAPRNGHGHGRRRVRCGRVGRARAARATRSTTSTSSGRTTSSPNGLVTHNSIYAFRGADIRNILDFERDFPGSRSIALEQNYRSTNAILGAANAVIEHNRDRKPKRLFSDLGEGEPVQVVEVEDEHAEARFVAAEIARSWRRAGRRRSSPSSTGRTRSRACWRTCSCGSRSRTR